MRRSLSFLLVLASCADAPEVDDTLATDTAALHGTQKGPVSLALDILEPRDIAVDATNAYVIRLGNEFGTGGELLRIPLAGGAPVHLVSTHGGAQVDLRDGFLYWGGENKIGRVRPDGTGKKILVVENAHVSSLVADATHVYWTQTHHGDLNSILRVPRAGGTIQTFYTGTNTIGGIVQDDLALYVPSAEGIRRVLKSGGSTLLTSERGTQIAVDDTHVYYRFGSTSVRRVPKTGGATTMVASVENGSGLAVDGSFVYVGELGHRIRRFSKAGGGSATYVVTNENPFVLLAGDSHLYWINLTGLPDSIRRIPKADIRGSSCPTGSVTTAAEGNDVFWLDATGTWIGYADSHSVYRVWRNGGIPEVLLDGIRISHFFADPDGLFFVDSDTDDVLQMTNHQLQLNQTYPPTDRRANLPGVQDLHADSNRLYAVTVDGSVRWIPKSGGGAGTVLMTNTDGTPRSVFQVTGWVYWAEQSSRENHVAVKRVSKSSAHTVEIIAVIPGIDPDDIIHLADAGDLAIDSTHVYVVVQNDPWDRIFRIPRAGGLAVEITPAAADRDEQRAGREINKLISGDDDLFFAGSDTRGGRMFRLPKTGGDISVVYADQDSIVGTTLDLEGPCLVFPSITGDTSLETNILKTRVE